ncbi:MAG: hypothetical protein GX201_08770 [Clostridiales bacterium]|nr:hypothetical protein [Clostridiales bacterium]
MFEEKRRGKRKFIAIVSGLVILTAFSIGYYISGALEDDTNSFNKMNENLKIPDSLKNITNVNVSNEINEEQIIEDNGVILDENYKVKYITLFTICNHSIERDTDLPLIFSGLNEEEFMEKNVGWDLVEIKENLITLKREIDTYCPNHYIISLEGQYIAIYTYNEDGERVLKETTDISIYALTPEDQAILESGIVSDTEEDLEQKLEGFSN